MVKLVDYYKVIQVDPDAHPDVIRAAYRALARLYHPDVEPGSAEMMVALNSAWAVLSNPATRAAYDRSRIVLPPRMAQAPSIEHEPGVGVVRESPSTHSTVLDFGRYEGWTLEEIARKDRNFLEWLSRVPIGRQFRPEIASILAAARAGRLAASGRHR